MSKNPVLSTTDFTVHLLKDQIHLLITLSYIEELFYEGLTTKIESVLLFALSDLYVYMKPLIIPTKQ
jgi:hypothetical protein